MNEIQSTFYLKVINLYEEKDMPLSVFVGLYEILFTELSLVGSDEVSLDHTMLMEKCMLFYAEQQDFERAGLLKRFIESSLEVFRARDEHLKKLKELLNKKRDDEETD